MGMDPTTGDRNPLSCSLGTGSETVGTLAQTNSILVETLITDRGRPFVEKLLIVYYDGDVWIVTSRVERSRRSNFHHDFALPFLICVVTVFQTGGFTVNQPMPWIVWPKVRGWGQGRV